ncbi:MAG: metallophosphoesterase [Planctomycetia bacterium]|nr:metallophosphoesterase [Planctomycetia bacterium]
MAAKRLLTLLHISDTHIAEPGCQTGGSRIDPSTLPRWRRGRVWHGVLSHSTPAMMALADFAARLRDNEGSVTVHTGDLTSWGASGQFEAARALLPEVLQDPRALDFSIPGNHDHWPGTGGVLGRSSSALGRCFPELPWIRHIPLGRHRLLTLAAIDTDADVPPWSSARAWGRGHFKSQIAALDLLMPAPMPGEIRVLLMHHSPMVQKYHLGIVKGSRAALAAFLPKHGIRVILCGHVHHPRAVVHRSRHGRILEARCGSTTQKDCIPSGATIARHGIPHNTLIVHRIEEDDEGTVTWRSELYRHGLRGFEPVGLLAAIPL